MTIKEGSHNFQENICNDNDNGDSDKSHDHNGDDAGSSGGDKDDNDDACGGGDDDYYDNSDRSSGSSDRPSIRFVLTVPPASSMNVGARSICSTNASHSVPRVWS